jgi:hypothetical protein
MLPAVTSGSETDLRESAAAVTFSETGGESVGNGAMAKCVIGIEISDLVYEEWK